MYINEIFSSIQGEGPFIGTPAIFIRTFGCVAPFCDFCDSKYSWMNNDSREKRNLTIDEIVNRVNELNIFNNDLVVITGGEPFVQKEIYELANALRDSDYIIQFETSGKVKINRDLLNKNDIIVMSPKKYNGEFLIYNDKTLFSADYYKFVIGNEEDMLITEKFISEKHLSSDKIYLMPLGATRDEQIKNLDMVTKYCIKYNYKLSPRLHILIWDNKRKV